MYIIKKTRLGVKHWRLQLQDKSGGVVFTAFYKDFTLADSLEHFKQTINDEQFGEGTFEHFDLSKPDSFSCDEIAEIFAYDGYEITEQEINF